MARFSLTCFITAALAVFLAIAPAMANDTPQNPTRAFQLAEATPDNQLPLLGDRFRIDSAVDEISMVFFRDYGTQPVVLILPDGTKWYHSRHPEHVQWESGPDFDQVRIEQPMRGPWQISGALRPESRVMITSDIQFHADSLPPVVFAGETLRITGTFTEAGEPIPQRDFRSVITTRLFLVSTNNPEYENFGVPPRELAEFRDDGRGMDARARDGIFTGEIDFNVTPGEYIPSYRAETPLFRRNYEQDPIVVKSLPVTLHVEAGPREEQPHMLEISLSEDQLQVDDVIIRGDIEYPNGEVQRLDIRTRQGDSLRQRIPNYVFGTFAINLEIFATARDGREFAAQVPTYEFSARRPEPPPPTEQELAQQRSAERQAQQQQRIEAEKQEIRQRRTLIILVIAFNGVLVLAWIGYLWWRQRKLKK
ncbi:TIGR03503 family protein [Aliidiomarina minuta]|uniref:TIGR03503 family protein n=1 Tax=Aliidiomarina minuta TaxID=880057 RepID=A0A432W910_9GAMM|nr:TIGR03503 family protein [Aliidiomarina minuta]RUO26078.1 TIGR03503 family protein [Aliidiomarina minuta]